MPLCFLCFSCTHISSVKRDTPSSVYIMGFGVKDAKQLVDFFEAYVDKNNSVHLSRSQRINRAKRLAQYYIEESSLEGVNWDVAFVQMCLETGFLGFGGLVSPDMNNFCGLGALGPEQPGLIFPNERIGVRAHIQHLKAYGSTEPLVLECIDPRYKYVQPKGKAQDIYGLAGTWASDKEYGKKLYSLLLRLSEY